MDVTPIIEGLASFFTSSCTIRERASGHDGFNEANGAWTAVTGLTGLKCMDANGGPQRIWVTTPTGSSPATMVGPIGFLLAGFYPTIKSGQQAVVDTVVYMIDNVEFKSKALTKITVVRVV